MSCSSCVALDTHDDPSPLSHLASDQKVALFDRFELGSGEVLERVPVAYKTWGTLNGAGDNAMVVCHAFSGTCDVGDWWAQLMGRGKVFDPSVFFIVCCNVLGSPYGSASPLTRNPATGKPYGADFPVATVRDTVRLHKALLDALGVTVVQAVVGGSLGGMQHSAWCIGWSEAQRQAIYNDAKWQQGRYAPDDGPAGGLAAARMTAMLTYRSFGSFETRFGRKQQHSDDKKEIFGVQSYLFYQGDKFVKRFDANCYLRITQMLDSHDIGTGRGSYTDALKSIVQPTLIIGIDSDGLFVPAEQAEMAANIPNAELVMVESPDGHDGFLLEYHRMNDIITSWLKQRIPDVYLTAAPVIDAELDIKSPATASVSEDWDQ